MRLVPVANAFIGYHFNNYVTKNIGKWAKVKSKIRSSMFNQILLIKQEESDSVLWALPIIFHVGTADEKLTENVLTLYSQANKRLSLTEDQLNRVQALVDNEELSSIFRDQLPQIENEKVRKVLYDMALTTAAINLEPQKEHQQCLIDLANCLKIEYNESDLRDKVKYFSR